MTPLEILEAHKVSAFAGSDTACSCDRTWRTDAEYRAHVAQVLEQHMQEREAAVIESLADELGEYQNSHDVAECAAPVEGEVGRQATIDRWLEITEDPESWLRGKSKEHHANGFEYIRGIAYEAWQEGYDAGEICASGALDGDHECETNPYASEEPNDGC